MKLLFVVHYFLPQHQAGTEIYTGLLAQAFRQEGHQVMIFTSEDATLPPGRFKLQEDSWEGIPVFRLLRGEPPDFARTYLDPEIDAIFEKFLAEKKPDLVHFQHTFRLSAGMILLAQAAGLPAVVTLADFWFLCPPILLLQPGFKLCPGPSPELCARCGNAIGALYSGNLGSDWASSHHPLLAPAGKLIQAGTERLLQAGHALKRKLPATAVTRLRSWKTKREMTDPRSGFQHRLALITTRQKIMKESLAAANLVLAPSHFLRQMMISAQLISEDKIIHSDYGFDPSPFQNTRHASSDHLRFGFIGTPVEHKGLHIAIQAMNLLLDTNAELLVYGDLSWFPAYARKLKRLSRNPRVRFLGRFEHHQVANILAGLDLLIVPSLWYENSPLTIHEAFLAKVPVLVSGIGGMAELINQGGGKSFPPGDHQKLAQLMRELIEKPELVNTLRQTIPPVKTITQNLQELSTFYQRLLPS